MSASSLLPEKSKVKKRKRIEVQKSRKRQRFGNNEGMENQGGSSLIITAYRRGTERLPHGLISGMFLQNLLSPFGDFIGIFDQQPDINEESTQNSRELFNRIQERPSEFPMVELPQEIPDEEKDEKIEFEPNDENEDAKKNACRICYQRRIKTVALDCGHMFCCVTCARKLIFTQGKCSICRKRMKRGIKKVYKVTD